MTAGFSWPTLPVDSDSFLTFLLLRRIRSRTQLRMTRLVTQLCVREQTGKFAQRVASAEHGEIINEMGTLLQETPLPAKRIGEELTVKAFLPFLNVGSALILWKLN